MKDCRRAFLFLLAALWLAPAHAQQNDLIVEKKVFELPSYTTEGGATIKNVRVGWEAYGQPSADKSNVILVTHFYSGTSHAAGKYAPGDKAPGYWDSIIGPGKAIDTNKYYVISSDTLVNLNANTPNVVTTGPASINPDTGKPYGMTFPVVSMRDFINVQKALLESLGIRKLKAVVGASMGALQAYEWAVAYPDMVERIVPVIGAAGGNAMLVAWLDVWGQPIRLDPKWNGGDYYGKESPNQGLAAALKVVSLHANGWEWAEKTFGSAPVAEGQDPGASLDNQFKIVTALDQSGAGRASGADANHFLYLVRANQLAAADPAKIKTPALIIYSPTDLVFPPDWVERTAAVIKSNGTLVETVQITGPNGHLNGVLHIAQAGPRIARFLAN
ncbi:E22 family MetX-like putative esterase [Microvirga massiliensis]|uniref:E22 family MetX-like putative esterase n=1 Tax=Microvirga massiliensis TaxID=1033741 RepID=UPI000699A69D|nr:homoserine O-acetyltransferase [Microvirga massiliensis]